MEHFEGHGDHWCAVGFKDARVVIENAPKAIKEGIAARGYIYDFPENKGQLVPIMYPPKGAVQTCYMLLATDTSNTIESFFPVLEGIKNRVVIGQKYPWEDGIEGEIEVDWTNLPSLSFFAPYFRHNFDKIEPGAEVDVYLAGAAYVVEKAPMEYQIESGGMYEVALQDFLRDNPQKTKDDFPYMTIYMDDAVMLFPTGVYSDYEYRGKILELEYIKFLGEKIAKTKVCIEKDNHGYKTLINLYIPENSVRGVKLEIGTDIMARIWLTGYTKEGGRI